jgi:biopolymer transport protein TolQ
MNGMETIPAGASSVAANGLSIWHLILSADIIVQIVMLLLAAASFWCWTIIFSKFFTLRRIGRLADRFESIFWSGKPLDGLYERIGSRPDDPLSSVFVAAMAEWRRALANGKAQLSEKTTTVQERVERVMHLTVNREIDQLERHMGFLATVGSTAPFVGLFGTVWGIMNSFQSIAATKSTNLAVVAPGIAEALFATALGLVAAIPAVIAYNKLSSDLNRYGNRLDSFVQEFGAILARKLDDEQ